MLGKLAKGVVGFVVIVGAINYFTSDKPRFAPATSAGSVSPSSATPDGSTASVATTSTTPPAGPPLPAAQQSLLAVIDTAAQRYDAAANDMLKGGTRPERARAICELMKSDNVVSWVGVVETLSSNSEGNGVLELRIGEHAHVKTWNNGFSDTEDNTLIPHGSPLYATASSLREGQTVRFSGHFFRDQNDCFRETSMGVRGAMTDPEFLMRFTALATVN